MSSTNNKIAYFYEPDVGNFHYGMLNAIFSFSLLSFLSSRYIYHFFSIKVSFLKYIAILSIKI